MGIFWREVIEPKVLIHVENEPVKLMKPLKTKKKKTRSNWKDGISSQASIFEVWDELLVVPSKQDTMSPWG